jgi:hypothetical protein
MNVPNILRFFAQSSANPLYAVEMADGGNLEKANKTKRLSNCKINQWTWNYFQSA